MKKTIFLFAFAVICISACNSKTDEPAPGPIKCDAFAVKDIPLSLAQEMAGTYANRNTGAIQQIKMNADSLIKLLCGKDSVGLIMAYSGDTTTALIQIIKKGEANTYFNISDVFANALCPQPPSCDLRLY